MSVSLCVYLFVCLFPNSSEMTKPDELKFLSDDSSLDTEKFRLKNIRIRRTVSWKIACILATLAVNFILSSMNFKRIWEVARGWGD